MALTIDNASVGYDASGVVKVAKAFESTVEAATAKLKSDKDGVKKDVDKFWQGGGADTFKNNIESDVTNIVNALDKAKKVFRRELYAIINAMDKLDDNLIKARAK